MYYTIQNGNILIAENEGALTRFYNNVQELPADYEKDKYIVVDGELVINPSWEEEALLEAKSEKVKENDTARDNALNGGVTYKDILFDSDTDQKINLLATVSAMDDEDTIVWFGMNNQPLECTKLDLINIGGLITALHTFCWTKNAEIKGEIAEATTIEEVNSITINYNSEQVSDEVEEEEDENSNDLADTPL